MDEAVPVRAADVENAQPIERPAREREPEPPWHRGEPLPEDLLRLLGREGAPRADLRLDGLDRAHVPTLSPEGRRPPRKAASAQTDVTRVSVPIKSGKSRIEVALDRGKVTAGRSRQPIHEIELELKDGDAADCFELSGFHDVCLRD